MKKIMGIVLAVVVLAVVGIVLFPKVKVRETEIGVENLVPEEAFVYISRKEIGRDWERLKTSNFWKELISSEGWQERESRLQDLKGKIKSQWGVTLSEGDVIGLFGREVALALLPGEGDDLKPRGLLLSKVGVKTKVREQLARLGDKLSGEEKLSSETYKEFRITDLKTSLPEVRFSYALLGDWLVWGVGEDNSALKEAVDLYTGENRQSLANNSNFQEMRAKLPRERTGLFYFDVEKTLSAYSGERLGKVLKEKTPLGDMGNQINTSLEPLKTIGGATWFDKGLKAKLCLFINREKADKNLLEMYSRKPRKLESLNYIPEGTVIYAGSNCFGDMNTYWKRLRETLEKQDAAAAEGVFKGIETWEVKWGLSLQDDVFSWMGNEFAYAISEVDLEGMFPLPSYFLMLGVKNEKKAKETLTKLEDILKEVASKKGLPFPLEFKGENYEGEEIKSLQVPFLNPGYAFVNNFLIVSTDTSAIRKLMDTEMGKEPSLVDDVNFQRVKSVFTEKSNSLSYLNVEKSLDIIRNVAGWALLQQEMRLKKIKSRKASLDSREFESPEGQEGELETCRKKLEKKEEQVNILRTALEEKVYPLLETLKVVKALGINVLTDEEGAEQMLYLAVEE